MSVEMSWALDQLTGSRVEIDSEGPTGLACGCKCAGPCGEPVEAVNRGKPPGTYKRTPHFRHPKGVTGCKGPTPHDLAVVIADERLNQDIADNVPTMAEYNCDCGDRHAVNVLQLNGWAVRTLRNVRGEPKQYLRNRWPTNRRIEPDIMLVAKQDCGVATIEIVYSHQPEEYVLSEGFPVLVVPISTERDARALSDGVIYGGRLYNYPCPDPKCGVCGMRESAGCNLCLHCGDHNVNHTSRCAIHGNLHPLCQRCERCIDTAEPQNEVASAADHQLAFWENENVRRVLLHHPEQCERRLNRVSETCSCRMVVHTTTDSREWNRLSLDEKRNLETWRSILPVGGKRHRVESHE